MIPIAAAMQATGTTAGSSARAAQQPIKEARRREEHATATLTDEECAHLRASLTKIIQQLEPNRVDSGGA